MSTTHPTLSPLAAPPDAAVICPHCRLTTSDPFTGACPRCGAALPPPGGAAWREGRTLVVSRDAELPDRCVRCGDPGDGRRMRKRLYWHHPALYLLVPFWVIPYILVALAIRRTTTVTLSVCERHRRIRRWSLWGAWALFAAAIVTGIAAIAAGSALLGWLFVPLIVAAPSLGIGGRRLLVPTRMDDRLVRTVGVGRGFLDSLGDWAQPGAVMSAQGAAHPSPPAHAVVGPAEIVDILARAWPELRADETRAAEYAWALETLHPGVVESVVSSFARERRPLPSPAVLRIAVLARTRAEAPAVAAAASPQAARWAPPAVVAGPPRTSTGIVMALAGLAAVVALFSTGATWARVRAETTVDVAAADVAGSPIVSLSALVGVVACLIGGVLIWRRSAGARVRGCFAVACGAHGVAVIGALLGMNDVRVSQADVAATERAQGLAAIPGFVPAEISAAPALWTALVVSALGLVVAIYGNLALRRRDEV